MPTTPPVTHLLYLHGFRPPAAHQSKSHGSSRSAALTIGAVGSARNWPSRDSRWVGFTPWFWRAGWTALRRLSTQRLIRRGIWPGILAPKPADTTQHRHFFRASLHRRASGHGLRPGTTPARTLVLIAQGDEVSDWREMAACCIKAQVQRTEGSNHTLSDFDTHLPASLIFCISPDAQAVAQTP